MTKLRSIVILIYIILIFLILSATKTCANNLSITNVSMGDRAPSAGTVIVEFDLSWKNSWKTKINHDAVWITVRFYDTSSSPTDKKLCNFTTAGLDPIDVSTGSNSNIEIYIPQDKKGAFIRPANYGSTATVTATDLQFKINYSSCGFSNSNSVAATVVGLEMVYVAEGSFYAGDFSTSTGALVQGSSDTDPWYIESESAISVSNPASDGFRYVSAGNSSEDSTGSSFTIPGSFPKGYAGFYAMKYEITEGQWVEFFNSLGSTTARSARDLTNASHKNSDSVLNRNTISCSGSPRTCSTSRPYRAVGYLSWMDLAAFLDWSALRPASELEYEKMTRGPIKPIAGEFGWGTTSVTAAAVISGSDEDGTETITTSSANGHYNNTTLSGGDTGLGAGYTVGPLRNGIFSTSASTREISGAGYYGIMELSGNVWERIVTIGNTDGRLFAGTEGDGYLSIASGYEGNADEVDWPGMDVITSHGVTGAAGSGFRGGSYSDQISGARLRISDRNDAANSSTTVYPNAGGRGVRTYDGS